MFRKVFILIFALVSVSFITKADTAWEQAKTQTKWKQVKQKMGVTVYKKIIPNSPIVAFKGTTVINSPIEKVFAVLADNKYRKEWVDRLNQSKILERKGDFEYVIYQEFKVPWPMKNRDFVYRGKALRTAANQVKLQMSSITHPRAPKTVGVRAQLYHSAYVLTSIDKTKTHVEVEIFSDPKGTIPKWIVNLIQKNWPIKTLTGIRRQAAKDYIMARTLPSAVNVQLSRRVVEAPRQ